MTIVFNPLCRHTAFFQKIAQYSYRLFKNAQMQGAQNHDWRFSAAC
jgi:hypothetical protein